MKLHVVVGAAALLGIVTSAFALDDKQRAAAAQAVAKGPACKDAQPFYWEIGRVGGALANGRVGADAPDADTVMPIASASKWLYGAYVAQQRKGQLKADDVQALTMRSGYVNLKYESCIRLLPVRQSAETVAQCLNAGRNDAQDVQQVDRYHYNGGHFQHHAVAAMGLGDLNNAGLREAFARALGGDGALDFQSPQLAGGAKTSVAAYAAFLRKLLGGQLALAGLLGSHAVCTNPATCPDASYAPIPANESWHYSLGHWVEDDPAVGDGAFSSPGAFGFYPWIDADKTTYGVLARHHIGSQSAYVSVQCGRAIRKAWLTAPAP